MKLTLIQLLQQGVKAHKIGNLKKAENFYMEILEIEPTHPDANHNLGILKVSFKNFFFIKVI